MTENRWKILYIREISNYFNTPIGYVFATSCLFFNFLFFFIGVFDLIPGFFDARQASIRSYMNLLPLTFILMVPAVSMRIWAEERKSGTIEILATLPVTEIDLVVAKFLAAWTFVAGIVFASLPLAISVWFIGDLDWGTTLAMYLGSLLMAGAYVSMGMVISALTREQIVAFILIFFVSLFMFLGNYFILNRHLPRAIEIPAGDGHIYLPSLAGIIAFFTHSHHYASFSRGVVDLGDTVYYLSFMALMIFINVWLLRRER